MEAGMNNFIRNKRIARTVIFVLAITLAGLPLPAGERRGSDVVVVLIDGSKVKGELLAVKTDALLIYDKNSFQGKSIDLGQIAKVKVLRTFWGLTGMVFGLGVGVGIARLTYDESEFYVHQMRTSLIIMAFCTLAGGIFGAVKSAPTKITLIGESSLNVQQNLEKLKRHAREK
jgi:predicted membrane protein